MVPPAAEVRDTTPLGVARVVSRGFYKLQHALHEFAIDVDGWSCADLGASVGGFSQCLLACGAAGVVCADTARGILDYAVRRQDLVRVLERFNVLHDPPTEPVDLVVMDLGWTRQHLALPAASRWLAGDGRIISLIKPHYEGGEHLTDSDDAERIVHRTVDCVAELGLRCDALTRSPIAGSRRRGRGAREGTGNAEWLGLFRVGQAGDAAAQPG